MEAPILITGHSVLDVAIMEPDTPKEQSDRRIARDIMLRPGGDAFNQSAALAAAGLGVSILTVTGDDEAASIIDEGLISRGIRRVGRESTSRGASMISVITVDGDGQRSFITKKHDLPRTLTIDPSILEGVSILSYASFYGDDNLDAVSIDLLRAAKSRSITTVMDVTGGGRYTGGNLLSCAEYVDYFLPSIDEAAALTGFSRDSDPEAVSESLRGLGFDQHIIKLGERGCYVSIGDRAGIFAPEPISSIVDTTGAGDSFTAGFVYGLYKGYDTKSCIKYAQRLAALCISQRGAAFDEGIRLELE